MGSKKRIPTLPNGGLDITGIIEEMIEEDLANNPPSKEQPPATSPDVPIAPDSQEEEIE